MTKVVSYYTSCASSVGQRAALAALRSDQQPFDRMAEKFEKRSRLLYEGLNQIPGIKIRAAQGAFYLFPDIRSLTMDSRKFALELLDKEQVVVIPGEAFGRQSRGFIRLACTVSRKLLAQALERIHRFVRNCH